MPDESREVAAVASAVEAMVWESVTDDNPSVDADELPTDKVTEPSIPQMLLLVRIA